MNTKIIASFAAIIVASVAAIGGTVAYYTSQVSMTGATFMSESMALKIDDAIPGETQNWVDTFAVPISPWATVRPGSTGSQILDIKNVGTVDGTVKLRFNATEWSSLGDNLNFSVSYQQQVGSTPETAVFVPVASGTVAQFLNKSYDLGSLNGGQIGSVKIDWNVPTTAGNDIMGQTLILDTIFDLEQTH